MSQIPLTKKQAYEKLLRQNPYLSEYSAHEIGRMIDNIRIKPDYNLVLGEFEGGENVLFPEQFELIKS